MVRAIASTPVGASIGLITCASIPTPHLRLMRDVDPGKGTSRLLRLYWVDPILLDSIKHVFRAEIYSLDKLARCGRDWKREELGAA